MSSDSEAGEGRSEDQGNGDDNVSEDTKSPVPPTIVGWLVRLLSLALVIALGGYLTYMASQPEQEFALAVEADWDKAATRSGQYLVPVKVTNQANRPVRNLKLELGPGADGPIEIEIHLFGPGEETTFVAPLDAGQRLVTYKVLSYEE